jgi:VWFA-related protein
MVIATISPRARGLVAVALVASLVYFSPAQALAQRSSAPPVSRSPHSSQQTENRNLQFRSAVNRVIVDVVVTDAAGKPVHGLSQQDFAVTEDNVPQRVVSFDLHDFDTVSETLPPNLQLPANTFVDLPKVPERGPLYVLLLDLVNTETQDQMWSRQELLKFIDTKPAGTRFEVWVLSDELRLVQGFTSDRNLLAAALDSKHPKHHVPKVFLYGQNYGQGDKGAMISVFLFIAQQLEGLPGRKNLMWMANYFPFSTSPTEGDAFDLSQETKQAVDTMTRAQVAVYTFAACGISVDDPGCGAVPGNGANGVGVPVFSAVASSDVTSKTGGKAYRLNDFKEELAEATQDGANYYTLTYAPSNSAYDGKERHIKVQLTRPAEHGYELAYRRSYYADDPDAPVVQKISAKDEQGPPAPRKPGDSLMANMEYGAPMAHGLIFRAHVQAVGAPGLGTAAQMANLAEQPAYFQVRKKNRPATALKPIELQTYAVDFNVLLPPKTGGSGNTQPIALEFATAAFDAEGTMLNGVVENGVQNSSADAKSSRGQNANQPANEKFYRAQEQIDVPLAATSIRIAVRDMTTDHIGAIEVALPLAAEGPAQAAAPASPPQQADSAPAKPN